MICVDGKISLYNYFGTAGIFCLIFLPTSIQNVLSNLWCGLIWPPAVYFLVVNILIRALYKGNAYQVCTFFIKIYFLGLKGVIT